MCSIQWQTKNKLPEDGIAQLCRAHHPHYQQFVAAAAAAAAAAATAPSDFAAAAATSSDFANDSAEKYYSDGGCCLKLLVAMCYGLKADSGFPVLNLAMEPWKNFPAAQIRPNKNGLVNEVVRRWARQAKNPQNKEIGPRPKQWNMPKLQEWLEQNPVVDESDIAFVTASVASRKAVAEAAQKEENEENARLGAGNWNSTACMRLIHALVDHDDLKAKFLNRLDLPAGRASIENRVQLRATDVWHLLADKWNDPKFEPDTVALPQLHSNFAVSDIILYVDVADLTVATAEKVEDKWSTMVLEMNKCIANWQKSGEGEGGIGSNNELDHEFGSLKNRSQSALASRRNFFRDRQLYLLYLWEMLNTHDLLGSALQRLNNTVSATNGSSGVPSVIRATGNNNNEDDASDGPSSKGSNSVIASLGKSIEKHGQSLVDVAKIDANQKDKFAKMQAKEKQKERVHQEMAELRSEIRKLKGEKRSLIIQHAAESQKKNSVLADAIMEQVSDIQMDIEQNSNKLASLADTPRKRNSTPDE